MANIKVGDSIKANIAGCVENFQKRISKNGNKYAFVGLSDTTGNFEGMMFSDGLAKYEDKNNAKKEFAVHQCGPCGEHDGFHSARGCIRAGSGCG